MSVAPRPQTDESPADAEAAEGWALLDGLRRRLDEQANQNRKTQSEVRQLAESIGALVAQQRKRSRWINVNSFGAYLIFTVLCGSAAYFVFQSRARELMTERDRVATERDTAVRRADEAIKKTTARDAADVKAWDAYQLLEAGKREDAAKKLVELHGAPLSKFERTVLEAKAKQAEVVQIDLAIKNAGAAFKAGRHADAVAPLEAALALDPSGPRAPLMHYYLGVAASKAGALDSAIAHLQAAVDGNLDLEDVRFHLASALDRAGQWGKAKIEYEGFATAHPMSSYTWYATRRAAALSRLPAVRPANQTQEMAATQQAALDKAGTQDLPKPLASPATAQPAAPAKPAPRFAPKPATSKPAATSAPAAKTLDFTNDDPAADGSAAQ